MRTCVRGTRPRGPGARLHSPPRHGTGRRIGAASDGSRIGWAQDRQMSAIKRIGSRHPTRPSRRLGSGWPHTSVRRPGSPCTRRTNTSADHVDRPPATKPRRAPDTRRQSAPGMPYRRSTRRRHRRQRGVAFDHGAGRVWSRAGTLIHLATVTESNQHSSVATGWSPVFLGPRVVLHPAPDLAAGKAWWTSVLGVEPYSTTSAATS